MAVVIHLVLKTDKNRVLLSFSDKIEAVLGFY
jgi:hypothetical protein